MPVNPLNLAEVTGYVAAKATKAMKLGSMSGTIQGGGNMSGLSDTVKNSGRKTGTTQKTGTSGSTTPKASDTGGVLQHILTDPTTDEYVW